jgi:hypothetical protein
MVGNLSFFLFSPGQAIAPIISATSFIRQTVALLRCCRSVPP